MKKQKQRNKTGKKMNKKQKVIGTAIMVLMIMTLFAVLIYAQTPEGATITFVTNTTKDTGAAAQARNDSKGAIHTVTLTAQNQNNKWKAYVGNVSSQFILADANGDRIYQWDLSANQQFNGQVYVSRKKTTVTWASITCADETEKTNEDTALGHDSDYSDSINRTFNNTDHAAMVVAGTTLNAGTCFSQATWVNDTEQVFDSNALFQELILHDGSDVVFATFLENDKVGYEGSDSENVICCCACRPIDRHKYLKICS